jgi:hypothetical protein
LNRSPLRTVVAAASLVVLGAAMGVTADRLLHRTPRVAGFQLADVQADPLGTIDRLIQLRPEQRERVAAILEKRQSNIDAVWQETHTKLIATIDSVISEIAAVLDPDQAERFRAAARKLHGLPEELHR